jgi:hypothetical protein
MVIALEELPEDVSVFWSSFLGGTMAMLKVPSASECRPGGIREPKLVERREGSGGASNSGLV